LIRRWALFADADKTTPLLIDRKKPSIIFDVSRQTLTIVNGFNGFSLIMYVKVLCKFV